MFDTFDWFKFKQNFKNPIDWNPSYIDLHFVKVINRFEVTIKLYGMLKSSDSSFFFLHLSFNWLRLSTKEGYQMLLVAELFYFHFEMVSSVCAVYASVCARSCTSTLSFCARWNLQQPNRHYETNVVKLMTCNLFVSTELHSLFYLLDAHRTNEQASIRAKESTRIA